MLDGAELVLFKSASTLQCLLRKAPEKTDLQAAQEMQKTKADLFELFHKP